MTRAHAWTRSSYCDSGACLEARWTTSSRSIGGSECVEARYTGAVQVRDSKLGEASPILTFSAPAWRAFLDGLHDGTIVGRNA